ncbi:CoB--CoM heterodisulfide reductase iron-sulfur subunit B family protein [Candidatus Bipolaricaulota bacterium]|nr:CoB--CoM heterodisulfide reductase iron-sulfur subunit B family protein [Candidatus Bipolaricaulota bacterium]
MKRIPYFPGCAMKDQARDYERAAQAALAALGCELVELPRWNCCGTVYSLANDDLMRHVGPVRNLIRVQDMGEDRVLTLCAMCYGTLRRSARFVAADPERLSRINAFMSDEHDYRGGVEVLHLLGLLRDVVGYENLASKVVRPLTGVRAAPYYGCTLVRPREVGVDNPDQPEVFERVLSALGAEVAEFPYKVECCGAYLTVGAPAIVAGRVRDIVASAAANGADLIVTSCPLCQFNLEARRPGIGPRLPVAYLGQLLAWALGADACLPPEAEALIQGTTPAAAGAQQR